ncbi:hypothetical protein K502DRAFT_234628 [Neoconidiobolus thromboides FSU 785]|nr:hypothetical protein K502DRAFT_234628 [Neoconidiobolus thromboides FSU 785]
MMDYDHDNGDYYQYGGYTDDDSDKIDSETEEALQSYLNYNSFSATNKVAGKTEKSKEEKRIIAIDDDSDSKYNIKKKNNIVIDLTSNLEPGEIINSSDIDVDERNETISISSDDESNESDDGEQRSVVLEAKEIKTSDIQADKDFLTSQAKEKGRYFNSVPMAKKCFKCDGDHLQANCPVKDSCTLCGKRGHIDRYCSLLLMCFNCKEKGHRKEVKSY